MLNYFLWKNAPSVDCFDFVFDEVILLVATTGGKGSPSLPSSSSSVEISCHSFSVTTQYTLDHVVLLM